MDKPIMERPFGKTDLNLTCVGLGGEGILRTRGQEEEAVKVIRQAAEEGIKYFDSARAYQDSQKYLGQFWSKNPHLPPRIFQASKSASRDKKSALADLEDSLNTLGLDYLDLWQIHDLRSYQELERIEAPEGALEAFLEAREKGKVRFIGVTGHQDPEVLTRALSRWPVDTVMLPVNPVEGVIGGFLDGTLPAALKKGLAVIGMKIMGASHYIDAKAGITPELLIRYALSHEISLANVGCSSPEEVTTLAQVGRTFSPLSPEEKQEVEEIFQPFAQRLAYYRG